MKIIVIGAGIAGLSSYLFLKKHLSSLPGIDLEIQIYEGHDVASYIDKDVTPIVDGRCGQDPKSQVKEVTDTVVTDTVFTPEAIGSAIGIARNGLDVLSRLFWKDDDKFSFSSILSEMLREGHPATRWQMHSARGWLMANVSMIPKHVRQLARSQQHETASSNWYDSGINLIMISRQAFWSLLLRQVVDQYGADAIRHKKVTHLTIPPEDSSDEASVNFADGTSDTADLIIGADGLRSLVRRAMYSSPLIQRYLPNSTIPKTSLWGWLTSLFSSTQAPTEENTKDYITPRYSGLVGVGAFIPSSLLSSTNYPPSTMSVAFGPNGFFGYGYITSAPSKNERERLTLQGKTVVNPTPEPGPVSVFWSTFASPDPAPFALTPNNSRAKPYDFDKTAALRSIITRHRNWQNPAIAAIVSYLETHLSSSTNAADPNSSDPSPNSTFPPNPTETSSLYNSLGFYPTFTTPHLPTYTLTSNTASIVLVGDAAHALQPSSGQGACQALEDAESLALLLKQHLTKGDHTSSNTTTTTTTATATTTTRTHTLSQALTKFNTLRIPRLNKIQAESEKFASLKTDMSFVQEWIMYIAIWIVMKVEALGLGQRKGQGYQEFVLGYDLPEAVRGVLD